MEKEVPELGVKKLIAITKRVGVGKTEKGDFVHAGFSAWNILTFFCLPHPNSLGYGY